ncbi:hypothetical protein ACFTXM_08330 [Streptomyces sp. NPDC056930]|uniref:hypothetical protein n=1 Tax=Streptomyces sp. NPDC056930 TaxID=3345967 RepID=UPI0036331D1A
MRSQPRRALLRHPAIPSRLNRGGDRQANAALHRIVQTRLSCDPRTQEYCERRLKQGKPRREIVRRLKRYAAREVFHVVMAMQS